MKKHQRGKKYLAIHAHFYQPPREDPWTGAIPRQASAHPYADWNERIARECYIPNAYARINDSRGRAVEIVNNYGYLNFNFGPTLLSWLEKRHPACYARITGAAAASRAACGRSNAIAQAYNHSILPLAPFDDRLTQVLWGLADFERRFGFKAEAMWLPETAADADTLRLLIDQGLRYAILSPYQAERIKVSGSRVWTDVSDGNFDTRRPYVWRDRAPDGTPIGGRSIALFFYNGPLSKAVAFEGSIRNSESFASGLAAAFDREPEEDQLLLLAVDGETFGHHHKFSDMTLAHAFRHEFGKHGLQTVNLSSYLDSHPAEHEADIKAGPDGDGTAWSCAHGVRRWKGGCDCGAENGGHTMWRAPMRAAFELLRNEAASLYRERGGALLKDAWRARNEYVSLFSAPAAWSAEAFLTEHAARPLSPEEKTFILKLLELQKDVNFMFTSCGWFFSDISRIEPAQDLKYAAKAVSSLRELGGEDIEKEFLSILELAPSNERSFVNGRKVYEALAASEAQSTKELAAFSIFRNLLSGEGPAGPDASGRTYLMKDMKARAPGDLELVSGRLLAEEPLVLSSGEFSFLYVRRGRGLPEVWLGGSAAMGGFSELCGSAAGMDAVASGAGALRAERIGIEDLSAGQREAVIGWFVRSVRRGGREKLAGTLGGYLRAVEAVPGEGHTAAAELRREAAAYAEFALEGLFSELAAGGGADTLSELHAMAESLARHGVAVSFPSEPGDASECAMDAVALTRRDPSAGNLERLSRLLRTVSLLKLNDAFFHIQNGLSELFSEVMADPGKWTDRAGALKELYAASGIIIERFSLALGRAPEASGPDRRSPAQ